MHGGKTATSTSTYHGDDNEDHVDLNYDMMMIMMMMVTTTDTMMTMTAVFLKRPAESVQCMRIVQMTIMAHTGIIPNLHTISGSCVRSTVRRFLYFFYS